MLSKGHGTQRECSFESFKTKQCLEDGPFDLQNLIPNSLRLSGKKHSAYACKDYIGRAGDIRDKHNNKWGKVQILVHTKLCFASLTHPSAFAKHVEKNSWYLQWSAMSSLSDQRNVRLDGPSLLSSSSFSRLQCICNSMHSRKCCLFFKARCYWCQLKVQCANCNSFHGNIFTSLIGHLIKFNSLDFAFAKWSKERGVSGQRP